jgi:ubiquinone/menaquinone biosynthesis C-methylase UbiE
VRENFASSNSRRRTLRATLQIVAMDILLFMLDVFRLTEFLNPYMPNSHYVQTCITQLQAQDRSFSHYHLVCAHTISLCVQDIEN